MKGKKEVLKMRCKGVHLLAMVFFLIFSAFSRVAFAQATPDQIGLFEANRQAAGMPPATGGPSPTEDRLVTAGWSIFGATYGIAVLCGIGGAWLFMIPVVGPAVVAVAKEDDWELDTLMSALLWSWTLLQTLGVVLFAIGYGLRNRHSRASTNRSSSSSSMRFALTPVGFDNTLANP